jgi:hypothetical protein
MRSRNRKIVLDFNMRDAARAAARHGKPVWQRRASKMDEAIRTALTEKLPIRAVILDGSMRRWSQNNPKASEVHWRRLDSVHWAVTLYDPETGDCRLTRGAAPRSVSAKLGSTAPFSNPLSITPDRVAIESALEGRQRLVKHLSRERSSRLAKMKKAVTLQQTGVLACEVCGFDFARAYPGIGLPFIEVHHLRALSATAKPTRTVLQHLSLLCSNCHRMIHFTDPMMSPIAFRRMLKSRP